MISLMERSGLTEKNRSVSFNLKGLKKDHFFAGLFPAVQLAAAEALNADQQCVDELVGLYEKRRNVLVAECARIGWDIKAPQGSFFAWLPVPEGFTSVEFADFLLEKADISVAGRPAYGIWDRGSH